MPWDQTELFAGIVAEFAGAQSRYVNATAIQAEVLSNRRHRRRERLAEYNRRWCAKNREKRAAMVRKAVRAHWMRNREAMRMKARAAYLARKANAGRAE